MDFATCPRLVSTSFACALVGVLGLASGCGDSGGDYGGSETGAGSGYEGDSASYGESSGGGTTGGGSASDGSGDGGLSGTDGGDDSGADPSDGETSGGEPIEPGQLTAGEWRDLDHWDFWTNILEVLSWTEYEERWGYFTTERYAVVVTDGEVPLADAEVRLVDNSQAIVWEARTDNLGRAELFAGLFGEAVGDGLQVVVSSGGAQASADAVPFAGDPQVIDLEGGAQPPAALDLMFMIDTTGSMLDELKYLQSELADVITNVKANAGEQVDIRLSVNFYRDAGDEYLVRSFPFTTDIDQALAQLADQTADGGGDYPEGVHWALEDAMFNHEWSDSARARLMFLVLDAPPHHHEDIVADLHTATEEAARQGIRVIPIGASGVDKETEFLTRFIDIATGGTYVFLTSDSGIGGEHIEPTIGEYEVELLNALLVRLIGAAIAS